MAFDTTSSLPTPGSSSYLSSLLAHVAAQRHLDGFAPDPVLFSAILLNLIVNRGGLIVDVPRHVDRKGKRRAIQHISTICEGIFGRSTHAASLDGDEGPEAVAYHLLYSPSDGHSTPGYGSGIGLADADDDSPGGLRVPEALILTGLEGISGPTLLQIGEALNKRSIAPPSSSHGESSRLPLCPDFLLIWIRHAGHVPPPGWWTDQFASSVSIDPADLPRSPKLDSLPDTAVIPREYIADLRRLLPFTHIHPPLQVHISNLFSAIAAHPHLMPTLTGKAIRLFPLYVKAHRLLSAPFALPPDWETALQRIHQPSTDIKGGLKKQSRDKDVVASWARLAGEEPTLADLTGVADDAEDGWYATADNVRGVWDLCLRHRVRLRDVKAGGIMWMLNTSAGEVAGGEEDQASTRPDHHVDRILGRIIDTV